MTKTMTSRFPGTCTTCHSAFPAGTPIVWVKGVGARHQRPEQCIAAPPQPVVHADTSGITAFIARAANRLKSPKARFLGPDGRAELRIGIAGSRSRRPGATLVLLDGQFLGYVDKGEVIGGLRHRPDVLATLAAIAADPAKAAKEYGALMCRCSFCGLQLTDAGSVEVGYGPICADHYGLPWGRGGVPELHPLPQEPDDDALIAERQWEPNS